jgi:hypothetical protein
MIQSFHESNLKRKALLLMRRVLPQAFCILAATLLCAVNGCVYVRTPDLPSHRGVDFRPLVGAAESNAPIHIGVSLASVTQRLGEPWEHYGHVFVFQYDTVRGWGITLWPSHGWLTPEPDYRSHYLFLRFDKCDKLIAYRRWSQPYSARGNDEGKELKRFIADTDPPTTQASPIDATSDPPAPATASPQSGCLVARQIVAHV